MANLRHAHRQLFRRTPDEIFDSFDALIGHCRQQKEESVERWHLPQFLSTDRDDDKFLLKIGNDGSYAMNDWSFTQLCNLARVNKETVNRLSAETAGTVFRETLPIGNKPRQVLTANDRVRSIHGVTYTRLWNIELLSVMQEFATDVQPPQKASSRGTGLYAGEQDMFVFLIDPTGWAEIEGEAFAPGFFCWNSEVGRRSVGISTFWFQSVCANHIVWDAVEVVEFSRKHTANVHDALSQIRTTLEQLISRRDERRDGFVRILRNAMTEKLGDDADETLKILAKSGINRTLAKKALAIAQKKGAFTIFSFVDALTRLAGELPNAGDRLAADQNASSLLQLAAV